MAHGVPGPVVNAPALLVEDALQTIMNHMLEQYNLNLEFAYGDWKAFDGTVIRNIPKVNPERFYITEAIDPLECPAVFIVPDRTEHDNRAQNFILQMHRIMVGFLVEDIEATTLARLTFRYVKAGYMTLHDKQIGNCYCLIESVDYSPIFRKAKGDGRQFRKDATLRLRVTHLERF